MKILSEQTHRKISGGVGPFTFLSEVAIQCVEYAFDQWKESRIRKHKKYQDYCEITHIDNHPIESEIIPLSSEGSAV